MATEQSVHDHSPATEATLPACGDLVGHYELIRELGRGGMGTVFLARDTKLGRRVAVKFLHTDHAEVAERFIREARATARCHHENIIVIHEVGEHGVSPYMVLEYLHGSPLSKLLEGGHKIPAGRAVELIVPVVRALARAHEHNIVHRDLKPDNIFVTESGTVKVLDFGIAKLVDAHTPAVLAERERVPSVTKDDGPEGKAITRQGALVGTLPYMSPEQWGADSIDHRTDIWAVGIILFEMIAGRRPLSGRTGWGLGVTAILDMPMPSIRQAAPELPDEFAEVIDRCLYKRKDERFGSAGELLERLATLTPGHRTRTMSSAESPYAGLRAFQEVDAGRFFGRGRDVLAAVTRLRERPLLGIVGPSGVGKSSFVRAGVVPALKRSGEPWSSIVLRPGRQPATALARVVAPMLTQSSTTLSGALSQHDDVLQRLHTEPGYFGTVLRNRARQHGHKLLLFVDQFEELYTLGVDPVERSTFTACLASVADDVTTPLRVMLSIRSDFLDRVADDPHFMAELSRGLFFLGAPRRDDLREALTQPAEMAGYRFESARIIESMLDHLEHTSGALPMLQFTAARLWDVRDTERKLLTEASYRAMGGIAGALASHADAVVTGLPTATQALVRALFLRLVTPERTRAVVALHELNDLAENPGELKNLVDQLAAARLLVVQSGEGDRVGNVSVEIVHESLLHSWPALRRWLDDNQDDAEFLDQLRTAARQWDSRGQPVGLLWTGEAMEEARRWHRRYTGQLPDVQGDYLAAVFALATRATRRRRLLVASIIVMLSLLVAASAVVLVLIRNAEREASQQAAVARSAEATVREQLHTVQREQKMRRTAQVERSDALGQAQRARKRAEAANRELEGVNESLQEALDQATSAQLREQLAALRARRSARAAQIAEAMARSAARAAELANERLQRLLKEREARIKRLEEQRGVIVRDVKTASVQSGQP